MIDLFPNSTIKVSDEDTLIHLEYEMMVNVLENESNVQRIDTVSS